MKNGSRFKLWQSIVLVILVGVAPMVAITLGVITISINKDINFGRWEAYGIQYQRPLESILNDLSVYKDACQRGDRGAMGSTASQIEASFLDLDAAQKELGDELQFTSDGLASRGREAADNRSLKKEWEAIGSAEPASVAASDKVETLVSHVRMAIAHLGDTSNLILDPDLDSYYLMDMTLCALPQTQERTGVMTATVEGWLRDGTIASHTAEIAAMAALYGEADIARIDGDRQTVLNEDANFYGRCDSLQSNLPRAFDSYIQANNAFLGLLKKMAAGEEAPTADELATAGWQAHTQTYALWKTSADELDRLLETRISAYSHKRTISLISILAALVLSGLVTYFFVRRLQKTLTELAAKLRENASYLVEISDQISSASKSLADSTNQQATSIEETSASLEELASMSKGNTDSASHVTTLVANMREAAENGGKEMDGLSSAMTSLQNSSKDVAQIVRTIDEIAFQTNILALNAAVEAARAGESGAGFAVVADEVRSLAQRSAKAAKETATQIESALRDAESGAAISTKVRCVLEDISQRVHSIDESAARVADSSREQNQGVQQINMAITQIDESTQKNAAGAEESAATAAELENQAHSLEESVQGLTVLI